MTRKNSAIDPTIFGQANEDLETSLQEAFIEVRQQTEKICANLEIEDLVVQPAAYVSPPKWHLAHTSWFFDCFVLAPLELAQTSK